MYIRMQWRVAEENDAFEAREIKRDFNNLYLNEWPKFVVIVATVIKLIVCLLWYRLRAYNTPEYTKQIFFIGLVMDIMISMLVVWYIKVGHKREFGDDDSDDDEVGGEELIPIPNW